MRNMRELISVSEVRLIPRAFAREASAEGHPRPPPSPQPSSHDVDRYPLCFSFSFFFNRVVALTRARLDSQEYMKSKNWRVPKRNAVGSSDAQRALAGLIIQSRKDFHDEFGEEA